MMYFVFAYNEHMALGGSEDCQGIFDDFSGALVKAFQIIDAFEDVYIETIRDNKFILLAYKRGEGFINDQGAKITIQGRNVTIEAGGQKWSLDLNHPDDELADLISDELGR